MAATQDSAEATMIANLKEKTGKSLDDWLKIAKKTGASQHGALVRALKEEHGLTHGYANLVAMKHLKSDAGSLAADGADLIALQYAGEKAPLRPIYDALAKAALEFGGDVEFAPKKAYVSLRRSKQFAIIQPSTKNRVDLGLNLRGVAATARLEESGSFNSMVSHRIRLEKPGDVDKDVIAWMKKAYDGA